MKSIEVYNNRKADSTKIWLLFLFLGWSYGSLGSMGKQVLFYLTLGGLGFWTVYRLLTLSKAIKKHNKKVAIESGLSSDDLMKLNLI